MLLEMENKKTMMQQITNRKQKHLKIKMVQIKILEMVMAIEVEILRVVILKAKIRLAKHRMAQMETRKVVMKLKTEQMEQIIKVARKRKNQSRKNLRLRNW